jgi:hypothetical protein
MMVSIREPSGSHHPEYRRLHQARADALGAYFNTPDYRAERLNVKFFGRRQG